MHPRPAMPMVLVCAALACGGSDAADRRAEEGEDVGPEAARVARTLEVFFTRGDSMVAVERSEPVEPAADPAADARPPLESAIRALLRGPTPEERDLGLTSWFSEETMGLLRGAELDADGHVVVDFGGLPSVIPGASSSAGSEQLLQQLHATVFQFQDVRTAEYRLEGSCEAFWNWLQRGCTIVHRSGGPGTAAEGGPG